MAVERIYIEVYEGGIDYKQIDLDPDVRINFVLKGDKGESEIERRITIYEDEEAIEVYASSQLQVEPMSMNIVRIERSLRRRLQRKAQIRKMRRAAKEAKT